MRGGGGGGGLRVWSSRSGGAPGLTLPAPPPCHRDPQPRSPAPFFPSIRAALLRACCGTRRVPGQGRVRFCLHQKITLESPAKEPNCGAGSAPGVTGERLAGEGAAEKVPGRQPCSAPPALPALPSHFRLPHPCAYRAVNHPHARPALAHIVDGPGLCRL